MTPITSAGRWYTPGNAVFKRSIGQTILPGQVGKYYDQFNPDNTKKKKTMAAIVSIINNSRRAFAEAQLFYLLYPLIVKQRIPIARARFTTKGV